MRILRNADQGTYYIVPVSEDEKALTETLLSDIPLLSKLAYAGRTERDGESMRLRFKSDGSISLEISASDTESEDALSTMRDMCFFGGTGGLIFLSAVSVEGVRALSCTGGFCKLCSKPMIGISVGEDAVCVTCSETNCTHEFEPTVFLSPAFGGLVATDACKHCHRMSDESFARLKSTPKIKRLEDATAFLRDQGIGFDMYLGGPRQPLGMSLEDAVALRDSGTIPEHLQRMVDNDPAALKLFEHLAEDMRTRT